MTADNNSTTSGASPHAKNESSIGM
jgi:hypothetical protein